MYSVIKRVLGCLISLFALIVLLLPFLIIAIWIRVESPGPIFFKQKRIGKGKRIFNILKFRTMKNDAPEDTPTHLLHEPQQYITKSGSFLRKTSIDELPQLINIIKGDMALVGPRPALHNQYDLIAQRDLYGANDVPAGLTGWAQINGRDEAPIDVKARLDGEYVQKRSLGFDVHIIFRTAKSVLHADGIAEGRQGNGRKGDEV